MHKCWTCLSWLQMLYMPLILRNEPFNIWGSGRRVGLEDLKTKQSCSVQLREKKPAKKALNKRKTLQDCRNKFDCAVLGDKIILLVRLLAWTESNGPPLKKIRQVWHVHKYQIYKLFSTGCNNSSQMTIGLTRFWCTWVFPDSQACPVYNGLSKSRHF